MLPRDEYFYNQSWDFRAGANARAAGDPFDANQNAEWKRGWNEANEILDKD